jgi:putative aldouronate transport system substrate-binding protein
MGNGVLDSTGVNFYTPVSTDIIIDQYTDAAKEALAAYGVNMWMDLYPPPETWPPSRVGAAWQIPLEADSHINDYVGTVRDVYMKRLVPEAIMAPSPDKFNEKWEEFMQSISDLDSDGAHAEFTALVKERARLFGTDAD